MSVSFVTVESQPRRPSGVSVPAEFIVVACIALAGLAVSLAMIEFAEYDWLGTMQLGLL